MRGLDRRFARVDVAAAAYAAAFFVWLCVRTAGTPATEWIAVVAFVPLGLAVAWADWRNARLPGIDARTRAAWMLLAVAAVVLDLSGSAWDLYLRLGGTAAPVWPDQVETSYHLLVVAAFLAFPGRVFDRAVRGRVFVDVVLVVAAGALVSFYFSLRLWFGPLQNEHVSWLLLGPGLDWFVLSVAAVGTLQKRDRITRGAFGFLLAAGTVYTGANYFFTLADFGRNGTAQYRPGDAVDGLWFLAWALRWAAARWWWYGHRAAAAAARDTAGAMPGYYHAGTAYLVVGGCFVLLTSQVFSGDERFLPLLAFSTMAMVSALLVRQLVELRESDRLFEAQSSQEARLRSLVDHSSDAVLVVDVRGEVAYASETAGMVFGALCPVRPGVRLPDVVRDDDKGALERVIEGRGGLRRLLMHVRAQDPEWREIEAVWSDLRGDPAVGGIVINCRDVTEKAELERQLRHAQKLDALGQLAGGLAHDVNNALAVVRGYSELLRDELEPGSAGFDDLVHVEQAVNRASSITRKVLEFSRKQPAEPTVLDLSGVVRDLLPMLRQSVTARVEIQVELEERLWGVRADRAQMEQVLVNLATNARDAMPNGGRVAVVTANVPGESDAPARAGLPPGDYVSLSVSDEGVGIAPDVRERIFEPFFSTKSASGGMGLGLAMVHDIVVASKAAIVVESEPGRGARFTMLLPRTKARADAVVREPAPAARGVRRQTVLVVDDEENVRVITRRMLERFGYDVVEAAGGAEALAVLRDPTRTVDLLLTDLVMPGVPGRELISHCAVIRPSLPVVCMTGFAGNGDDPRQFGERLAGLVSKPFSVDTLERAVAGALAAAEGGRG